MGVETGGRDGDQSWRWVLCIIDPRAAETTPFQRLGRKPHSPFLWLRAIEVRAAQSGSLLQSVPASAGVSLGITPLTKTGTASPTSLEAVVS